MSNNQRAEPDKNKNLPISVSHRVREYPHLFLPAFFAWLRGWWYKVKFSLQLKKFSAGRYFRVYGPLFISGPGEVKFGDNCLIISNAIKPVCIRTLSKKAIVKLGNHAGLNGSSIQCIKKVEIGELSNIADAYITDTAAHSLNKDRRNCSVEDIKSLPINIGKNVWVSVQVVILHGVNIGDNSVIGACSLVRKDVPSNVFSAGNPLKVIKPIED